MTSRIKEIASWVFIGVIALILLAMGAYQTLVFGVDTFEVAGNVRLTTEEVLEAAHIEPKQMLWNIDADKVEANLANLPWVREARMHRVFPASVEIVVEERNPVYSMQLNDEQWVFMDSEGVVLDRQNVEESLLQPSVVIETPLDVQFGLRPLNVSSDRWTCFLKVLNWTGSLVGNTNFRLTALTETEMQFWLTDLLKVEIVDMNDGDYIVDMLARILTDLHRREISAGTIRLEAGYDARFIQAE